MGALSKIPSYSQTHFFCPSVLQIWIPMNTSSQGIPAYQAFTVGGRLDSQRGGGFPLASSLEFGSGDFDFSAILRNAVSARTLDQPNKFLRGGGRQNSFFKSAQPVRFLFDKNQIRFRMTQNLKTLLKKSKSSPTPTIKAIAF